MNQQLSFETIPDTLQSKSRGINLSLNHIHHWVYETPNGKFSQSHCQCGAISKGLNGFPDDAYSFRNEFMLDSNRVIRPLDNPIDTILECRKSPHIFDRKY
jgi:hypothetical protein